MSTNKINNMKNVGDKNNHVLDKIIEKADELDSLLKKLVKEEYVLVKKSDLAQNQMKKRA